MANSLFRREVLEFARQDREFGQVAGLLTPSLTALSWFLVTAVGAMLVFICIADYTRKETVRGYLVPTMGTAQVFVPQQGAVTAIHVGEGQTVAQGDVLLTIDTAQLTGDGIDVNEARLRGLSTQKLLLRNQIDAEERSMRTEKDRLTAAITSGEAELTQLSSQIKLQEEQIQLAQNLVDSATKMRTSGYLSAPELYKRQESLLASKQALSGFTLQELKHISVYS